MINLPDIYANRPSMSDFYKNQFNFLDKAQNLPSAVREYEYFIKLNPEQQRAYTSLKRMSPQEALLSKGIRYDPATGTAYQVTGFGQTLGDIGSLKVMGEQQARAQTEPAIQEEIARRRLGQELTMQPKITTAQQEAKSLAETNISLREQKAYLPSLLKTVDKMRDLGQKATYTLVGQGVDALRRQSGKKVGEGAVARTEYMSTLDNETIPLLRLTFGPQFTEKDRESLRGTLGDPDKSPEEKDAILRSFINQKISKIESLERLSKASQAVQSPTTQQEAQAQQVIDYKEFFK